MKTIKHFYLYFFGFHHFWKQLLKTDAKAYTGLYSRLRRIVDGTAKEQGKILKEWCTRTESKFNSTEANEICQEKILPLTQTYNLKKSKRIVKRLLSAARAAGIQSDGKKELTLKSDNIGAYIDLNDNELFEDDVIEVVSPAWFQNGVLIEQGYCYKKHNDK